jgi:hypothetical protein
LDTCNGLAVVAGTPGVPGTQGAWPICDEAWQALQECLAQRGRGLFGWWKCQLEWNVTSGLAFKHRSTFIANYKFGKYFYNGSEEEGAGNINILILLITEVLGDSYLITNIINSLTNTR